MLAHLQLLLNQWALVVWFRQVRGIRLSAFDLWELSLKPR
jgi:hypothetical protein